MILKSAFIAVLSSLGHSGHDGERKVRISSTCVDISLIFVLAPKRKSVQSGYDTRKKSLKCPIRL